ncbi:hypothetical protein QVD17_11790 [Tagetes erecta]|uniref:PB1-like domain-containing protein n=1 Tax=Tagetes erecta TaxID=13708 RepID=A0AAD8KYR6_TARER|nr:hypothetical protein QVD17_11790 [Tagetes erecta]
MDDPANPTTLFNANSTSSLKTWKIRENNQLFDYSKAYDDKLTLFSLKIFHDGKFLNSPIKEYMNGEISFIAYVNVYDISLRLLDEMVKSIGYPYDMKIFYQFKAPYVRLDLGLKSLKEDHDFDDLCTHVRKGYKVIEIYVEKIMDNEDGSCDDIVDVNNPMHDKNEDMDMGHFLGCVRHESHNEIETEREDLEVDHDNFDSQIQISRSKASDSWCVETLSHEHKCLQVREVAMYIMSSIAKEIKPMVESNPKIHLSTIHDVQVSLNKVKRAKKIALQKIHGHYQEQYTLLRAYCEELLKAKPWEHH